ncbi:PH domain-containing protein [Stenotrophomonas sp. 24(2023)]|uniref:PH domain-containing protein n=1 Tax=Stenotrophomonas sp. 24(2023) TaxID=3068324 RepID=UPI0027DF9A76|nr:PH domain-containing protein [Stenotrophomonas sp. 24(2023)]WMJ70649.1 PH domain-containing protein [Stenotrophomonas sp. 24(2023)]
MSHPPPLPSPLPADGGDHRLHPWSWLFVLLMQLRHYLLPLIALVVFGQRGDRDPFWAHLTPLIVLVVLVGISIAQYLSFRYRIGADAITVRSGLLSRNRREIPFARIHNVEVQQNPLHRVFGVAEVRLESAGGTEPEAQMRVLRLDQALALEQLVRQRAQAPTAAQDAAQAVPPPLPGAHADAGGQVLLRLPTAELVRLGLLSNRGWVLVAAAVGGLLQLLPRNQLDSVIERGGREAFGYATHLQGGLPTLLLVGVAVLLAGWLLLRVLSVALALLRYHGFTLGEQDRRLTVVSGMFSRTRSSVARRRIQAWTLQETLLQRLFGRRQLRIDSAAGGTGEHGQQRALRELAPLATPAACDALVQHLLPQVQWPPAQWQPVPQRGWWRLSLDALLLVPLISAVLVWRWGPWGLLALAWLPLSLWVARQQIARIGWHVDERLVAVRGGWWTRWWRWAELDKVQGLRLQRTPLDKLLGTASLVLDTAGAQGDVPLQLRFLDLAQARRLMDQLGGALARRKLRW